MFGLRPSITGTERLDLSL